MTSLNIDALELSCTWSIANERNIKDAITIEMSKNKEFKSDLDDLVRVETCVQLYTTDVSSSPELKFNISSDLNVSAVKVISEARIIELYGRGGEYLSTTHSEFVDDFEGMAVYSAFVQLDIPSCECSIKFNKLKHQDNLWLYGIGIYVEECKDFKTKSVHVDLKSVSERLQQSGCNLTENAGQCMKLLQTFQTLENGSDKNSVQMDNLDRNQSQKAMTSETSRKLCNLLLHMPPFHNGSKTITNSVSALPEELKKLSLYDSANVNIAFLIGEQFKKLEQSLMAKVDERLNTIEQKLDSLLLLFQRGELNKQSDQAHDSNGQVILDWKNS